MTIRPPLNFVLSILALLVFSSPAFAKDPPDATIVYDVLLHEFTCWKEGPLPIVPPTNPCALGEWHPITGNMYFVRGQFVSILVVNAVAQDLFEVDVKVDDLTEPSTPVSGSLSELPKLLPISAAPAVFPGSGVAFAAAAGTVSASDIYNLLVTADTAGFKSWVQNTLISPLSTKEVTDFAAVDTAKAIAQLTTPANLIPDFINEAQTLTTSADQITDPGDVVQLLSNARTLTKLLDSESGLKSRINIAGVAASGKVISDALSTTNTTPLQQAMAIDLDDLTNFTANFALAFPDAVRYSRIRAIVLDANNQLKFSPTYTEGGNLPTGADNFLQRVTQSSLIPLNNDAVTALKTNLGTLASLWGDIDAAKRRRQRLAQISAILGQGIVSRDSNTGIFELQRRLNTLANSTVLAAAKLNAAARTIPLPAQQRVLPVGQWFSSKTITVTVKQGQRVALFDLGSVSDTSHSSVIASDTSSSKTPQGASDTPSPKPSQGATTDLSAARPIQFPIYNLYHFKVGLGFIYSTVPDNQFQVTTVTIGSGPTQTTEKFIDQTQSQDYTILGTANLMIFPWAETPFPWRPRYIGDRRPAYYKNLAPMVGFSLTSPTKDFFLGGAYFPRTSPVGIQLGWHIALRYYPPSGYVPNQPVEGRVVVLPQKELNGFFVGLVFTTDFFAKTFASIFKQ
jgi:hypothetical protein